MNQIERINQTSNSYLTFRLGNEKFASHVSHVQSIAEAPTITEVPNMPDYMTGIMDLRGEAIPVIDLSSRFGKSGTKISSSTCVLVMEIQISDSVQTIGALVDDVHEVLEFTEGQILPPPKLNNKLVNAIIYGVVKEEDAFIMLLDINLFFSLEDLIIYSEKVDTTTSIEL